MMPNETTIMQTSCIQDNPEADECNENIPTGDVTAAGKTKFKVQAEDVMGHSSMQLNEEHGPLSETCTFSTPAPTNGNSGGKRKSQLSGFQSALTPILKYLNIDTQRASPEPLRCGLSKINCQKSAEATGQKLNSSNPSGRLFSSMSSPVCLLDFEYLPEITHLDVTCDSTMQLTTNDSVLPEGAPATPKVCNAITCVEKGHAGPSELPKPIETTAGTGAEVKADDFSKNKTAPASSRILERYLSEITLLDVTCDSELSPGGQVSNMNVTQDMSQALSEVGGPTVAEPGRSEAVSNEDMSSTSVQSINTIKTSGEVTQDITMGSVLEHNGSSSKTSEENVENPQISTGNTFDNLPANITCNISSSSDTSAQSAHTSTSGMDCSSGPDRVILELRSEPTKTPDNIDGTNEELLTSEVSQQSSKTVVSEDNMVSVLPASSLRSFDFNTSAPVFCPENKKLDLPTSDANGLEVESQAADQAEPLPAERAFAVNQSCSFSKESSQCEVQNATFDRYSFQKSCGSTTIEEGVPPTVHIQNNTFDCKPPSQQNGTITLSETGSCDSHHSSLGKPPSPKVCNLTTSIKDGNSDDQPPELPKHTETTAVTGPHVKTVEKPNSTFEANPVLESVSGDGTCESKDQSQSGLTLTDGVSDTSNHQSMDGKHNEANTFNLDETLDLRVDALITSTPLTNCKISNLNIEREPGKILAAQKKLYGDGLSKPADQAPSNIICDRKTFLTQHTAKSFWPLSKVASRLLENKPGFTLPGRLEPATSGLPVKSQRTQADALRNAASEEIRKTTGVLSSYNLRSAAAASRLPSSGLQRPQVSGIPSSIQRAAPGLRPPSARVQTQANADKPCGPGPAAANLVTKNLQGKKHPLAKGQALPVSKRKKTDILVASNNTEAASTACDTTNKVKNFKQPTASQRSVPPKAQRIDVAVPASTSETIPACDGPSKIKSLKQPAISHKALLTKPQGQGCAKCTALEEQLKMKSEEIQKLKEELLKYRKQEDC